LQNFNFYSDNQIDFNKKTYVNPEKIFKLDKTTLITENLEKETLEATFDQQKFFEISGKKTRELEEKIINGNEW
jgi:hypothetical protein